MCTNAHSKPHSTHVHMNTQQTCVVIHTVYMHRHVCTNLHGTRKLTAHVHTLVQKHAELYCTHSTHAHVHTQDTCTVIAQCTCTHMHAQMCTIQDTTLMYTFHMHHACTVTAQYTCTHMLAQMCTT